jgi:periplasmic protein TonB
MEREAVIAAAIPESSARAGVLIINDEQHSRRALQAAFGEHYQLHFAASAAEALAAVARTRFEVLVTDHHLADMNCRAFLRELDRISPHTMALVLADPQESVSSASAINAANLFCILHKPCPLSEFGETIALAVSAARVEPARAGAAATLAPAAIDALLVDSSLAVLVLSGDATLCAALTTTTQGRYPLHQAADEADALAELARLAPAVLVIDAACSGNPAAFAARVHHCQPSAVIIIAAEREQASAHLGLVGQHGIARVLLKPISPGQTRLCLEASVRRHLDLLQADIEADQQVVEAALPGAGQQRGRRLALWAGCASAAVALVALSVWWLAPASQADLPRATAPRPASLQAEEPRPAATPGFSTAGSAGVAAEASLVSTADDITRRLALAEAALAAGLLLGPDAGSAESRFRDVLATYPDNGTARLGLERVWLAVLVAAEEAVQRGDLAEAESVAASLAERVPGHPRLTLVRQRLAQAEAQRSASRPAAAPPATAGAAENPASGTLPAWIEPLRLASQRLEEGALTAPAGDNAWEYYLLAAAEAGDHPEVGRLGEALTAVLYEEADRQLRVENFVTAQEHLERLALLDANSAALLLLQAQFETAQNAHTDRQLLELVQAEARLLRARRSSDAAASVVPESELTRVEYRAPDYPRRAYRLRQEGWVALQFTVGPDGYPREISVTAAEPVEVFEDNAIAALERWRYEPVFIDGDYVPQRAEVRLRFEIR